MKTKELNEYIEQEKFHQEVLQAERMADMVKELTEARMAMVHLENSIMREESENIVSDVKRVNDVLDIIEGKIK